ncbi:hypothetical protein Sjap_017298 [Stephania japonica]|uniref:HXXXD-type acyl-transferase family protein n=1 Tax=Stephania japonica TaxID=461633 RepID=A0AAP0NJ99_9MAGN
MSSSSEIIEIRLISTKTVGRCRRKIDLSPWDLKCLRIGHIQKGLLYHSPPPSTNSIMHRLETSLSLALHHFFPLAGRLATTTHDDGTISICIDCNNAGAELIHATARNVTVAHIKNHPAVNIVHDLFPLNGARNYDDEIPLLAVQATELFDGVFIGITMNHAVVDGTSFWHFVNTWSEICRTGTDHFVSAHPPVFQRWFPDDVLPPIRFQLDLNEEHPHDDHEQVLLTNPRKLEERVFHFTQESIAILKAKANAEQPLLIKRISSLQAVLAHIWVSVTRARRLPPDEETIYVLPIGNRARLVPPLPKHYFGAAVSLGMVVAKAGELLENGLGWAAAQLNQEINAHNDAAIRSATASWVKKAAVCSPLADLASKQVLFTGSSPMFNVYGNDFGWGRPIAVTSPAGNKLDGKMMVSEGCVKGSMNFEVCLAKETIRALADDADFMGEFTVFTA